MRLRSDGWSLHLGNLLGIVVLSWFQCCGHRAISLIGGATGHVGDPSSKSLERPEFDLQRNNAAIETWIFSILGRESARSKSNSGVDIEPNPDVSSRKKKNPILESGFGESGNLDGNCNVGTETNGNFDVKTVKDPILDDSFVILNNYDWWMDITLLDFLREVGRFARVGTMMAKESEEVVVV